MRGTPVLAQAPFLKRLSLTLTRSEPMVTSRKRVRSQKMPPDVETRLTSTQQSESIDSDAASEQEFKRVINETRKPLHLPVSSNSR